jgi:hypothetical protein
VERLTCPESYKVYLNRFDSAATGRNNPPTMVVGSRLRGLVSLLAMFAILGLGILPGEHIHGPRPDHGRDHPLLHSHLEPHHAADGPTAIDADDDDASVVWVGAVFTPQSTVNVSPPPYAVAPAPPLAVAPAWTASPVYRHGAVPVHGPPGRTVDAPRAPPSRPV